MDFKTFKKGVVLGVAVLAICALGLPAAFAQPPCPRTIPVFPGADDMILDPACINKYEIPLVIPPVMNNNGAPDNYDIAVRQFNQQILPGGIWNTLLETTSQTFPATTVWSYGPAADPTPAVAPATNSQFNYPAYTVETRSGTPVSVRWINDLVDSDGDCLPHILPIDQTLHWANPEQVCRNGPSRTDCAGNNPAPYTGPVPIVTHVHGAHVDPHSDGYPEAWWLPACNQASSYATSGTLFDDSTGTNPGNLGYADYYYRQDQPATTLWYHDHSLGMTRNNVYAGPAGFWLLRGGGFDMAKDSSTGMKAVFPGPAPVAGQGVLALNNPADLVRQSIREIPIVIQDRDIADTMPLGSKLYYPDNRARFELLNQAGGTPPVLDISFVPVNDSDVAPIWNPEAFFNIMVVNGVAWPDLEVAQARYRLRFLNGCNSRFLWLVFSDNRVKVWQIGAEQGFLPAPLDMNNLNVGGVTTPTGEAQILMALAERADTIVDFTGLDHGDVVFLFNVGPDEPFGGGEPSALTGCTPGVGDCFESADLFTTFQVMRFTVNAGLNGASPTDPTGATPATDPANLVLKAEKSLANRKIKVTRQVSLNELDSAQVCVEEDMAGNVVQTFDDDTSPVLPTSLDPVDGTPCYAPDAGEVRGEPFGPLEALLGTVICVSDADPTIITQDPFDPTIGCPVGSSVAGKPLKWTSENVGVPKTINVSSGPVTVWVTENPGLGHTEVWEMYNFTGDAHPIHLHLVRFEVLGRQPIGGGLARLPEPWESGFKDTTIAYPDEITRIRAKFDIAGLYVWHCHIVEHEDNEMMRPYFVGP